ncbi:MAG: signal peptidase I [Gorillibacterium sp.]|nr:signal peptidase I [Gorillibacterium sp.]
MESEEKIQPGVTVKSEVWEWTKAILIAVVLVILIRIFIFKPFIVDGPSMQPNFHTGERLIVSEWIYHLRHPQRGEVIVFHAEAKRDFIKRVIALPGETIGIKDGQVYVNGIVLDEPYIQEAIDQSVKVNGSVYNLDFAETTVPEGSVFVMGDNRLNSTDSRIIKAIPYDKIIGRADIVFWPLSKISIVNH